MLPSHLESGTASEREFRCPSGGDLIRRLMPLMLLASFVVLSPAAGRAQSRSAIPPEPERQKIQKQVDELTRPYGVSRKKEAIQKLKEVSYTPDLAADERYVVLTTLIALAQDTGDGTVWLESVNALIDSYEVDRQQEKLRMLGTFFGASKPGFQLQLVVEEAITVAQLAVEDDRFTDATGLLDSANSAVRKTGPEALRKAVGNARESVKSVEKEWKEFDAARVKLETDRQNAALNFAVGKWHAVYKRDWETALPFLAKGDDARWKAAAELEQPLPDGAAEQVAIADAWYDIAIKSPAAVRASLLQHARTWYELADGNLISTLRKQHVTDRLARLSQPAVPPAPADKPGIAEAGLPTGVWVDLLARMKVPEHAVVGNWRRLPDGDAVACDEFRYNSRIQAPVVVTGSYELQWSFIRHTGEEGLALNLPVGDTGCQLWLDTWRGTVSGLHKVDGKNVRESLGTGAAVNRTRPLENGKLHEVHVKLFQQQESSSIQVLLDGDPLINWKGKTTQLDPDGGNCLPNGHAVGVTVFDAFCEVQALKIKLARGGRGYWLGTDWRNPLQPVADKPLRELAAKCIDWKGRKYYFGNVAVPWPEAQRLADKAKGRLLTISSADEEEMILSQGQGQVYWMAAWRPQGGDWRDERNQSLRYQGIWGPGQPNNWPGEWKLAIHTDAKQRGWHDVPTHLNYCVCIEWGEE